ncbi:MAG TPA: S8 family peptidase [Rubrobacter sp.]|nr:S8 family peptidase [Rubrobacter sp.]
MFVGLQGATQEAMTQPARGDEPTYEDGSGRSFAPGEIIVAMKEPASQADLRELNRENGAAIEEDLPRSDVNVIDLPQDLTVTEAVKAYEQSPDVAYAEPNFKLQPAATPNDPNYRDLWGLNNTGHTGGTPDADADAPEAWDKTTGSPDTVVAVIDEGIDINYPDLRDNIWTNSGEVPDNNIDDDGNGYVDDVHGYDFANDDATVYDPDPITGEGDEHGTHVAGTIAAVGDNGIGVTGVNWHAQVASLKFLGANGGYTSDAVEAINYAVAEGMPISNNSWGGGGRSQALEDAIRRADDAGHIFIAAAGNGGSDGIGDDNDATPHYPSSYDVPNVVAVAASDDDDKLASFSNYGASSVDIAAPGVGILSTLPGNAYGRYSGTSMATPHVTGVAALIQSQQPGLGGPDADTQIKAQLLQYADEKASLQGKVATNGRLNALGSLTENSDTTGPRVTSPRPAPGGSTRNRTPNIAATVTDGETDLQKNSIKFSLDGNTRDAFSYDTGTDRLTYTPPRLAYGRHSAEIVAEDAAGNVTTYRWGFKVIR